MTSIFTARKPSASARSNSPPMRSIISPSVRPLGLPGQIVA